MDIRKHFGGDNTKKRKITPTTTEEDVFYLQEALDSTIKQLAKQEPLQRLQDRITNIESQLKLKQRNENFNFIKKYILFEAGLQGLGPVPDNTCIHIEDAWYQKNYGNFIHKTYIQGQPVFTLSLMTQEGLGNLYELILFFDNYSSPHWIIHNSENWCPASCPLLDELVWKIDEDEGKFPFEKTVDGLKFDWDKYDFGDTCKIYLTIGDTKIVIYEREDLSLVPLS